MVEAYCHVMILDRLNDPPKVFLREVIPPWRDFEGEMAFGEGEWLPSRISPVGIWSCELVFQLSGAQTCRKKGIVKILGEFRGPCYKQYISLNK